MNIVPDSNLLKFLSHVFYIADTCFQVIFKIFFLYWQGWKFPIFQAEINLSHDFSFEKKNFKNLRRYSLRFLIVI